MLTQDMIYCTAKKRWPSKEYFLSQCAKRQFYYRHWQISAFYIEEISGYLRNFGRQEMGTALWAHFIANYPDIGAATVDFAICA